VKTVDIAISVLGRKWTVGTNLAVLDSEWTTYRYIGGAAERKTLADDVRFFRARVRVEAKDGRELLSVIHARTWLRAFKWALHTGAATV